MVSNNTVYKAQVGIYLVTNQKNYIYNNKVHHNVQDGIKLDFFTKSNTIASNSVRSNTSVGIYAFQITNTSISNNNSYSNGFTGIWAVQSSGLNIIFNHKYFL